jgi:membrane protein
LRDQIGDIVSSILPADVTPLLTAYFTNSPRMRSPQALALAATVSFFGASGVMATLMEGLRRANELPRGPWTFWQRRARALLLVPLTFVPLGLASLLVVFGQWITLGLAAHLIPEVSPVFFVVSVALRWTTALAGVVVSTSIVYHLGVPVSRSWSITLPGACVATALWFVITLAFGWYVTRFANYAVVYGSLGAGIALLIWLSIMFLSVLCGAEFNHQFHLGATLPDSQSQSR